MTGMSLLGMLPLESNPQDGLQQRLFLHCQVHSLVSAEEVASKRVVKEEIFFLGSCHSKEKTTGLF